MAIDDQKQINQSVARITRNLIESDLGIQDSIARDYANISGIARLLKPKIEKINNEITDVIAKSDINVRTGVAKLSVKKNDRNQENIQNVILKNNEEFIQISEATSALTIIYSERLREKLLKIFNKSEILEDSNDLAAIIVHSPIEVISVPGFVFTIYGQVAKRQINIEDTVSCFTDTIIVVKTKDVAMTFSVLNELFDDSR